MSSLKTLFTHFVLTLVNLRSRHDTFNFSRELPIKYNDALAFTAGRLCVSRSVGAGLSGITDPSLRGVLEAMTSF